MPDAECRMPNTAARGTLHAGRRSRLAGALDGYAHRVLPAVCWLLIAAAPAAAQPPLFTDAFPLEEFAGRRERVLDRIGDGVAVLQGAPEPSAYVRFRQNNHFFYLSGVESPRALLLLDGRTRRTTLFLAPPDPSIEHSEGPQLAPGPEAAHLTGIADVRPRADFAAVLAAAVGKSRVLYMPFRPESLSATTPYTARRHADATRADPWDGRPSRADAFVARVKTAAPGAEVRDLDPLLDELRMIKSSREVALIREATRLSGVALMEAARAARPGMRERDLQAIGDYVFTMGGAQGPAYFALAATGANAIYPHYHAGAAPLGERDLVLLDYAPDYRYYTSDVARMFPASGRFTEAQRELYAAYLRLYLALRESIRPWASPAAIARDAGERMAAVVETLSLSSSAHAEAVRRFVDDFRAREHRSLGHFVGMEVHDVEVPYDVLRPGMVFTIEPELRVPAERLYLRLEDVILITPDGYENLSAFVPLEPDAIEALMEEDPLCRLPRGH
jgi:Xaa-Pro aminopeptidase